MGKKVAEYIRKCVRQSLQERLDAGTLAQVPAFFVDEPECHPRVIDEEVQESCGGYIIREWVLLDATGIITPISNISKVVALMDEASHEHLSQIIPAEGYIPYGWLDHDEGLFEHLLTEVETAVRDESFQFVSFACMPKMPQFAQFYSYADEAIAAAKRTQREDSKRRAN